MFEYNNKNEIKIIKIIYFSQELYTWDKGNQLTYPIRYHEIGYNVTSSEKYDDNLNPQMQTGHELYN